MFDSSVGSFAGEPGVCARTSIVTAKIAIAKFKMQNSKCKRGNACQNRAACMLHLAFCIAGWALFSNMLES
jgi:hypothetical protein